MDVILHTLQTLKFVILSIQTLSFKTKILHKILECNRDNQVIQQFMGIACVSVSISYSSIDIWNVRVCYWVKVTQMHCYFMTVYISNKLNQKQLTNQSLTAQPFIRSCSKQSLAFYRTESSLLCSKDLTAGPSPDLDEKCPVSHHTFFKTDLNSILSPTTTSHKHSLL